MNTTSIKAYGTDAPNADLKQLHIERREVAAKDIEIEILYEPKHYQFFLIVLLLMHVL